MFLITLNHSLIVTTGFLYLKHVDLRDAGLGRPSTFHKLKSPFHQLRLMWWLLSNNRTNSASPPPMVTEAAQESLQKTTNTPTNVDTSLETEYIDIPEIPPPLVVKGDLDIANGPQEQPVKVWVSPDTPLSFISATLARLLCTPIPLRNQQRMRGQINGLLTHGVKGRVVVDDIRYDGPFVVAPHDLPLGVDIILGHESIKPQMRKIDWEWLAEQAKLTWDAVAAEEAKTEATQTEAIDNTSNNKNTEGNNIDGKVNVSEDNFKDRVHDSTNNNFIPEKNNPIPKTNVPKANTDDSIANSNNIKVEHTNLTITDENDAEMTIDDNNLKVDETNDTSIDTNIMMETTLTFV
ncbi:hypothetical protein JNB11_05570 [Kocuria palustris]|nr:hypothetical protein [Kocuria palustris]